MGQPGVIKQNGIVYLLINDNTMAYSAYQNVNIYNAGVSKIRLVIMLNYRQRISFHGTAVIKTKKRLTNASSTFTHLLVHFTDVFARNPPKLEHSLNTKKAYFFTYEPAEYFMCVIT